MDVVDKVEVEGTSKGKVKGNVLVGIRTINCVQNLFIYASPAEGNAPDAFFFSDVSNICTFFPDCDIKT